MHDCVMTVSAVMPYPKQMQAIGPTHHGIAGYINNQASYTWRSDVGFGTRYHIALAVEIELSNDHSKVVNLLGEPTFTLFEYGPSPQKDAFDESKKIYTGFRVPAQVKFGKEKWAEVVKAGDDIEKILAVFGMKENKEVLPGFTEMMNESILTSKAMVPPP